MKIEINPRTLLHLQDICEVLYKLHPNVLDYLLDMQENLGNIFGLIDLNNVSLEEREFLSNHYSEPDYSSNVTPSTIERGQELTDSVNSLPPKALERGQELTDSVNLNTLEGALALSELSDKKASTEENTQRFYDLKKYLKLDTDEYIPIKIFIEIEDPVVGRKVRKLVRALETTRAIEQFQFGKRELDEDAYFAEGYGLQMNKDQRKQFDDFFKNKDVTSLRKNLIRRKLYEW